MTGKINNGTLKAVEVFVGVSKSRFYTKDIARAAGECLVQGKGCGGNEKQVY